MKCLITGGAGFVGSRLARRMLGRGDTIVALDNMDPYYPLEHKRRHLADLLPDPRFTFVEADLRDAAAMTELFKTHRPDAVAHLGGLAAVRYSIKHPLLYGQVNVVGSMNLFDAAVQAGGNLPNFVIASTSSVYGENTPVPFVETAVADRPLAAYPASKRAMELMAHAYHHLHGLPVTVARFFNVYGPHGRPDMMPWQWTLDIHNGKEITLYNAGRLKRDWTYVDDILSGVVAALDRPLGYEILNLGRGQPVENTTFITILERLVGKKAKIVDVPAPASEPPISYADTSKANRLLGYAPKTTFEEGLGEFVKWMRGVGILAG